MLTEIEKYNLIYNENSYPRNSDELRFLIEKLCEIYVIKRTSDAHQEVAETLEEILNDDYS